MLQPILCFFIVPIANLFLFWLWFRISLDLPFWEWFIPAYHGIEVVVILALLVGKTSRQIKTAALGALLGGIIGSLVEWWIINQVVKSAFEAVTDVLALLKSPIWMRHIVTRLDQLKPPDIPLEI